MHNSYLSKPTLTKALKCETNAPNYLCFTLQINIHVCTTCIFKLVLIIQRQMQLFIQLELKKNCITKLFSTTLSKQLETSLSTYIRLNHGM